MDINLIFNIVWIAITLGVVLVSYYFAVKRKIEAKSEQAINEAEELKKSGQEKMKSAIASVKETIPAFIRPLFSDEKIEVILQRVFDEMEKFARKQTKKGR